MPAFENINQPKEGKAPWRAKRKTRRPDLKVVKKEKLILLERNIAALKDCKEAFGRYLKFHEDPDAWMRPEYYRQITIEIDDSGQAQQKMPKKAKKAYFNKFRQNWFTNIDLRLQIIREVFKDPELEAARKKLKADLAKHNEKYPVAKKIFNMAAGNVLEFLTLKDLENYLDQLPLSDWTDFLEKKLKQFYKEYHIVDNLAYKEVFSDKMITLSSEKELTKAIDIFKQSDEYQQYLHDRKKLIGQAEQVMILAKDKINSLIKEQ